MRNRGMHSAYRSVDVDERSKHCKSDWHLRHQGHAGSANVPGARIDSVTWTDSDGNFWLFGGQGKSSTSSGYLNDLWRYDPFANMWTWMSGSITAGQIGTYGTKGVPDAANVPGARDGSVTWVDSYWRPVAVRGLWLR